MALQYAVDLRNAQLDQVETVVGASPILRIRSGAPPATVATADSGTVLVEMPLSADWMAAASAGSKAKSGTWEDTAADASGIAGHFRIYTSGGVAKLQGTVGESAADMIIDNTDINVGQPVSIVTFAISAGNA
jgi:hypothetical protein